MSKVDSHISDRCSHCHTKRIRSFVRSFVRPSVRPYLVGLLFSHKNGDFGAISVMERSCAVPSSKVKSHISDRCSHCHTKSIRSLFVVRWSVRPYRIGLLFSHENGDFGAISVTKRSCVDPISKVESHISDRCSQCHTKSICSFVRLFVRSFGRSLAGSLAQSLTHSFIYFCH